MLAVTVSWRGVVSVRRYARHHASPNSGYPESALAGILGCRFGGPNTYHGQLVDKPYIGDTARELGMMDFAKVRYINHAATILMLAGIAVWYAKVL
jgi:adenosylcobinamide-phosphate synthase